jgi:hypothetical protein
VWLTNGDCNYPNKYISSDAVIQTGDCAHVTVVHSDSEIKIYLNNQLIDGELTLGNYSTVYSSSENMTISCLKDFSGNYTGLFNGTIDELRFWNYKLSQTEITNYSNAPLNEDEIGLVAYFDMEDTGVGTNLTITNKATISGDITGTANGTAISPYFTNSCGSVGIYDIVEDDNAQIYPNPSSNIIFLSGYNNIQTIFIINLNGKIVKRISNSTKINIKTLPIGVYFVRVVLLQIIKL